MSKKMIARFALLLLCVCFIFTACSTPAPEASAEPSESAAPEAPSEEAPSEAPSEAASEEPSEEAPKDTGGADSGAEDMTANIFEGQDLSDITVGMTYAHVSIDNYQSASYNEFNRYAEELGIKVTVLDALMDANQQSNQVDDLIAQKVDVIIVWAVNGDTIVPALKRAYDAGIPVVVGDSPVSEEGYDYIVGYGGTDNIQQGINAAEMCIEGLGGKGKVVELMGTPGYVNAEDRSTGVKQTLEAAAPGIEYLETQPTDWSREKAQSVMENLLTKYPEINGVVCCNDNVAIGAINALQALGRMDGTIVTACNNYAEGYELIKQGILYGSEEQSPQKETRLFMNMAVKAALGEPVEFFTYLPTPKITLDNIDEMPPPEF
ncbi:MAG: sugar ABC transporter substrate-binding protein [Christensenellaceae bacterium]